MSTDISDFIHNNLTVLDYEKALLCLGTASAAINNQQIVCECTKEFVRGSYELAYFYEALLQSYLFAGFPAALEALSTFTATVESMNVEFKPPLVEEYNVDEFTRRGVNTCTSIYTNVYQTIRERLKETSPHLDEWMIVEGYGKTLSRPQLGLETRELVNVAILAVTGWQRQLYSHLRGAMNVGAHEEECIDAMKCTLFLKGEEVFVSAMNVFNKIRYKL